MIIISRTLAFCIWYVTLPKAKSWPCSVTKHHLLKATFSPITCQLFFFLLSPKLLFKEIQVENHLGISKNELLLILQKMLTFMFP